MKTDIVYFLRVSRHGWSWDGETTVVFVVLTRVSTVVLRDRGVLHDGDDDPIYRRFSAREGVDDRGSTSTAHTWDCTTGTVTTTVYVNSCLR